jgi:general secretion pathway protein K
VKHARAVTKRPRVAKREGGFALLLVLWSLVLLSLILSQVLSVGRTEAQLAANLRRAAIAEAVADGAVQQTIFHLLQSPPRRMLPAMQSEVVLPDGAASVVVENVAGKVNPNTAAAPLLSAMLRRCGTSSRTAAAISQAILTWRSPPNQAGDARNAVAAAPYRSADLPYAPPGAPFETSGEIGLVLGMTPALRGCLSPHISIYQQQEDPSPAAADSFVIAAMTAAARETGDAIVNDADQPDEITVTITADARLHGGGRFQRRATVRLTATPGGQPFRILNWESLG